MQLRNQQGTRLLEKTESPPLQLIILQGFLKRAVSLRITIVQERKSYLVRYFIDISSSKFCYHLQYRRKNDSQCDVPKPKNAHLYRNPPRTLPRGGGIRILSGIRAHLLSSFVHACVSVSSPPPRCSGSERKETHTKACLNRISVRERRETLRLNGRWTNQIRGNEEGIEVLCHRESTAE